MNNIRVVDMTSVLSGPFCTWLLSTLGADVIKVENPGGDLARTTPPFKDDTSLYFASLNRNKRSVVLDLKSDSGKQALHRLLATADVFIENMRPGVRNRLGCSDKELKDINPGLICASISGFGQTGSLSYRPAYDIVVQAMSGMMSINGPADGTQTRVGFSVGDIQRHCSLLLEFWSVFIVVMHGLKHKLSHWIFPCWPASGPVWKTHSRAI